MINREGKFADRDYVVRSVLRVLNVENTALREACILAMVRVGLMCLRVIGLHVCDTDTTRRRSHTVVMQFARWCPRYWHG